MSVSSRPLLIFDSHPVQYRAPLYRELQRQAPDQFEVIYATDCSVRGHRDAGFGATFAWDDPLLEGYPHRILGNEVGEPLKGRKSLSGRSVRKLLGEIRPSVVYLTGFAYDFDWAAFLGALVRRIPVWIRMETQDEAFCRGKLKGLLRELFYRLIYKGVATAFCIGQLNREHYLRHGIPAARLRLARYCTVDRLAGVGREEKVARRAKLREKLGFVDGSTVVGFFGKLISKKDPGLVLEAVSELVSRCPDRPVACLYVGSGELEEELRVKAAGLNVVWAGFVNQQALADYYLATDVMVLPSRRRGETWGLVVNEALQAGCAVAVTECVGSSREFGSLERVRIVPEHDAAALSEALLELSAFSRDFDWARPRMAEYSIEAAAASLAQEIKSLCLRED